MVDVGILTIKDEEFGALLAEFSDEPGRCVGASGRHYNLRSTPAGNGRRYRVAIVRLVDQGTGEAQDAARDVLQDLGPRLLLVVGIAGGRPSEDFTLGDVVLSLRVHDYTVEARKHDAPATYALSGGAVGRAIEGHVANLRAREDELGPWWESLPPRAPVSLDAKNFTGPTPWRDETREALKHHFEGSPRDRPTFRAGAIGSSDRLIGDPAILIDWLGTARNLLAVEMEAAGVYRAARERCAMLAIRGISDIVGFKRDERWTRYACASAAAFARAYLRTEPIPVQDEPSTAAVERPPSPGAAQIDLAHLPVPATTRVFGRESLVQRLVECVERDDVTVVGLVAPGGTGKSTVLHAFLNEVAPNYLGATRVLGWSFYSQGSRKTYTTSSLFLEYALAGAGAEPAVTTDDRRALRLVASLDEARALLVLDGVEPLQHTPAEGGRLRDAGLRTLLTQLARNGLGRGGLVLVTSRQPLVELAGLRGYKEIAVDNLDVASGRLLLQHLGVRDTTAPARPPPDDEITKAVNELGRHALALTLLGNYLRRAHDGDVLARLALHAGGEPTSQVGRVLAYYDQLWPGGTGESALLNAVAIFDRPVQVDDVDVVLRSEALPGAPRSVRTPACRIALANLIECGLVVRDALDRLDCHPLIREHVQRRLRRDHPDAFLQAHGVVFDALKAHEPPENPTLAELEPLIRAVHHGCLARRHKEALDDVYYARILGEDEYLRMVLAAHPTSLYLCAHFFDDSFENVVAHGLDASDEAWLFSEASLTLLMLGRPAVAASLIRTNLARFEALEEHGNVSYSYENLVDALTLLGQLDEAFAEARNGLAQSRRVVAVEDDYFREVVLMCHFAYVHYLRGDTKEALALYERAEAIQLAKRQRTLTSAIGYRHTSMLLDLATTDREYEDALARAQFARTWSQHNSNPADSGRDAINVARALGALGRTDEARLVIDDAVATLRSVNRADYLAEALLGRASFLADLPNERSFDAALREDDLACCTDLIELGDLRCLHCDLLMLRAELALRQKTLAKAREYVTYAMAIAGQCGLHVRDGQLHELAARCAS